MTREEAILFFKDMNECPYGNLEAVEMAIKSLEQEPILDKIRTEVEQKLDTHGYISLYNRAIHDVLMIIDRYKIESEDKG